MIIRRTWAEDVEVPDAWSAPGKLAKHRIYLYWSHPEHFPCDARGFRIPAGFASFEEKYRKSERRQRIFCFGGSTTFGWYCAYTDSYPHHLESLLEDAAVFNCGLGGSDLRGALDLLVDLLRGGFVPDLAIFLDGVNEKQGWLQAVMGQERYEEMFYLYPYFREQIERRGIGRWLARCGERFRRGWERRTAGRESRPDPLRFVQDQGDSYLRTCTAIRTLAPAWPVDVRLYLQPTLWDVLAPERSLRYEYMKAVYRHITVGSEGLVKDLSVGTRLEPGMFIDWQHCTGPGNRVLAEDIARALLRSNEREAGGLPSLRGGRDG